jgi:hypothetical protein
VQSYIVIQRSSGTAVALNYESPKRIYCLGDGDIVQFPALTNASLRVSVPKYDDIQVGSSEPEVDAGISHTPNPSTSLEVVSETPGVSRLYSPPKSPTDSEIMPFSTAKAKVTQDITSVHGNGSQSSATGPIGLKADIDQNEGNPSDIDHNLGSRSTSPPNITADLGPKPDRATEQNDIVADEDSTQSESDENELLQQSIVTSVGESPKRMSRPHKRRAPDDLFSASTKKARAIGVSPIASSNEEPSDESIKTKKRGRPKKGTDDSHIAVQPRSEGPMVVINQEARRSRTPSSTVTSTRSTTERSSNTANAYQGPKPTVVFSSSGFDGLPTMLKRFKALTTVNETVTDETTFLW